jgi:hypothetical protein
MLIVADKHFMLNAVMLSVVMLDVIMLNVVMLNVVAFVGSKVCKALFH